ncbi:RB69ORF130c hypothetical protein [Escherichia phage RB69]|uniref:Uncharacterized protein RB69ORF130c n=1 Tax=Escherichia phage RB69 TaxID=12353 RepID=Q7Y515_BPR69|nr:RB69ORF130c hypothetical protein [Escherichia phage RB69]AAP76032.1 RB69ORF130c hypothetical protein [Escherichia phage RB69]
MSIAIYVKSESLDSYLYTYDTDVPEEQIKDDLDMDLDLFRPIADYKLAVSNSESPSKETRIEEFMSELMAKSWDRDDE